MHVDIDHTWNLFYELKNIYVVLYLVEQRARCESHDCCYLTTQKHWNVRNLCFITNLLLMGFLFSYVCFKNFMLVSVRTSSLICFHAVLPWCDSVTICGALIRLVGVWGLIHVKERHLGVQLLLWDLSFAERLKHDQFSYGFRIRAIIHKHHTAFVPNYIQVISTFRYGV